MNKVKIWYCYYYDSATKEHWHTFTDDKDCLSPDAVFVTYFNTDNISRLARLIEQYAKNTKENVTYYVLHYGREYENGVLVYDSSTHVMTPPAVYAVLRDTLEE